jgi:hypothetical protein
MSKLIDRMVAIGQQWCPFGMSIVKRQFAQLDALP